MIRLDANECPLCEGALEKRSEIRDIHLGNRTATVPHSFYRCDSCREDLYTPEQMEAVQLLASDKIRDEEGLLRSSEIRSIRTRLGLSQHHLEQLLGVGPKTVVRWEKGTVFQNGATDSLLRVIADVSGAAPYLARMHGVDLPADKVGEQPLRDEYDFRDDVHGKHTRHGIEDVSG